MRVFVAGGTGALGRPVIGQLVAAGHEVIGLTRHQAKAYVISDLGAEPVVADALDAGALGNAIRASEPHAVVHALTAIPKHGPLRRGDMDKTNRLRRQATAGLLDAAIEVGARRFVAESMIFAYGFGDHGDEPITEGDRSASASGTPWLEEAVDAVRLLETQVQTRTATGVIEGVTLRFGFFYGLTAGTEAMVRLLRHRLLPIAGDGEGIGCWIHIDDAATAVVRALTRGRPGEAYNIVDDEPVRYRDFLETLCAEIGAPAPFRIPGWVGRIAFPFLTASLDSRIRVSNSKARQELMWTPAYPTFREGFAEIGRRFRDSGPGRDVR